MPARETSPTVGFNPTSPVIADGHVTEFEDNLMWRAADLLGVSSRDRIALRQRVAGEQESGG